MVFVLIIIHVFFKLLVPHKLWTKGIFIIFLKLFVEKVEGAIYITKEFKVIAKFFKISILKIKINALGVVNITELII